MHIVLLCENERSPRRVVELGRLRGELRQRGLKARVCAWRDRASLSRGEWREAIVVLAMFRSTKMDRDLATWLRTGGGAKHQGLVPSREVALSALADGGRGALVARGVPCALPSAERGDEDPVTSVYLVGELCTHVVRRVSGIPRAVRLGTAALLLASQARAAYVEAESFSGEGRPQASVAGLSVGLPTSFVRVDLVGREGDDDLRVIAVDPIVHMFCAHLHPPVVARIADGICAGLCERLASAETVRSRPQEV